MTTPTLRLTIAALTVLALIGGVALVSADDGDSDSGAIEWIHEMHETIGMSDHDHGTHHDGSHDHSAHHDGNHEHGAFHDGDGPC